jgi:hypothetical protein
MMLMVAILPESTNSIYCRLSSISILSLGRFDRRLSFFTQESSKSQSMTFITVWHKVTNGVTILIASKLILNSNYSGIDATAVYSRVVANFVA